MDNNQYPAGKLNDNDEGNLQMVTFAEKGTVIVNFGKPVAWFGLPPSMARDLAALLIKQAEIAEKQQH